MSYIQATKNSCVNLHLILVHQNHQLYSGCRTSLPRSTSIQWIPNFITRGRNGSVLLRTTYFLLLCISQLLYSPTYNLKSIFVLIYLIGKWWECCKNNALKVTICWPFELEINMIRHVWLLRGFSDLYHLIVLFGPTCTTLWCNWASPVPPHGSISCYLKQSKSLPDFSWTLKFAM